MKKNGTKELMEKQVDYKRHGMILLAVGAFFYLGTILPTEDKIMSELTIMMSASMLFLAGSIYFFTKSKKFQQALDEINELNE